MLSRITHYAAAYARSNQPPPASAPSSSQASNGSKTTSNTSRTSPVIQAQAARRLTSRSSIELHSLDTSNELTNAGKRDRGLNPTILPESPSKARHRQPSIFPGVVRQRTRRQSLRQSSGSENDYDASGGSGFGLSRSGILEPNGKGPSLAVPEKTDL